MTTSTLELRRLTRTYEGLAPEDILQLALKRYRAIGISFSGAEDVVLIDMAMRIRKDVSVFTLDTGRLHPETYRFLENVRAHYDIDLEVLFPDSEALAALVRKKGLYSFYRDGHQECCGIRKVAPLKRKLNSLDAWITGQRRDQSPCTRTAIPVLQEDPAFSSPEHTLVKFNPLAHWTAEQVWDYIIKEDVPYNPLHRQGYVSIGCEPCTRPVLPHQHERAGRWWWEDSSGKECGLHVANLVHER